MRIHTIIHAPFEKAGAIEKWATDKGYQLLATHTYRGEKLPSLSAVDFLVIMGGPQSPAELDKYPYLREEITFTRQIIDHKKPVLGICLGAQIISESLGAKTEHSPNKEVGIFPIQLTTDGEDDPIFKQFPKIFEVIHWHNDMPGIPEGSLVLAKSDGCPRQAIRYSNRVYGLQFHMEMTSELLTGMVKHCPQDLNPGRYIQETTKLLSADLTEINSKMFAILNYLAALVDKSIGRPFQVEHDICH